MSVVSEVNTEVQTTMNLVLSEMRVVQRKNDKMVKQKEFLQKCHKKAMKELKKAIQQKRKRQIQEKKSRLAHKRSMMQIRKQGRFTFSIYI